MSEDQTPYIEQATLRCLVCGQGDIAYEVDARNAECPNCGATTKSMHLASMLIGEASAGVAATLRNLVLEGFLDSRRVVDFTDDQTVHELLKGQRSYTAVRILETTTGTTDEFGATLLHQIATIGANLGDLMMFRDILCFVPSLDGLLKEVRRVLSPGGSIILQDRFSWPLPERTRETACSSLHQSLLRDNFESGWRYEEVNVPIRRHIGADIVDILDSHGFNAYIDRPLVCLMFSNRIMGIVARARE